jgi:hypothetical protein
MVDFEKSSPSDMPNLVGSQWFGDAGVGRGVDPEVAKDLGYKDPAELAKSGFGDPKKRAELERRETEGDARLLAAMETEMREGKAFHQRLSEVPPPPEDAQK